MKTKFKEHARKRIEDLDFSGSVSYTYNTDRSNCDCGDGPCRCSTIEDFEIEHFYPETPQYMTDTIAYNFNLVNNEKKKYAISRVLVKVSKDDFSSDIRRGYYGEDLEGVRFENTRIINTINAIIDSSNDDEAIRIALKAEYGYLLDELKDCHFEIVEIDPKDLIFGQVDHYRKLNPEIVENYKDYDGICGIVKKRSVNHTEGYAILDGYHRCKAVSERMLSDTKHVTKRGKNAKKLTMTVLLVVPILMSK